jgi:hypothetical protein
MKKSSYRLSSGTRAVMFLALTGVTGITLAVPTAVSAQERRTGGQDRRDGTQDRRDGNQDRGQDRRDGTQDNRTDRNADRRTDARGDRRRDRDESRVRFTRSGEERRFDNGAVLHRSAAADRRFDTYFPRHVVSYSHYVLNREGGRAVLSPFSLYIGVFPPYVERSAVIVRSPSRVYIDPPITVRGEYRPGWDGRDAYDRGDDDSLWKDDRSLSNAVYDLEDTFRNEDIALLAPLTDPRTDVAIFTRGRYQYSINANDYLDMTRDFLRSVRTNDFVTSRVRRRADGVYQVFTRHTYQDQDGRSRAVDLCFVLERRRGQWTVTQVDSYPGRVAR